MQEATLQLESTADESDADSIPEFPDQSYAAKLLQAYLMTHSPVPLVAPSSSSDMSKAALVENAFVQALNPLKPEKNAGDKVILMKLRQNLTNKTSPAHYSETEYAALRADLLKEPEY